MAIYTYCPRCFTSNSLKASQCSKCGTVFGRSKKYRVSVQIKGKRTTRVVENLTIAREVEAASKGDLVRGEFEIADHRVREKPVTLTDVWNRYLPWAKEHKGTWRDDDYHYGKHLEPRFGSMPLQSITPFEIEKMKLELKKGLNAHGKPYAAATIKHQLVLLRRLFNIAIKWEMYAGGNPVSKVQMPKLDNQRTEFLTEEELSRLMETLESWPCRESVVFVKFAMLTGVRRGEIFKLTWDAVDFERNMVTLRGPKGGKTTTLPMNPLAVEVLQSLNVTSTFVFPGEGGKQRTDFKGPWLKIRKAAGLPSNFRFCGLRHNFASYLVSNGVDLYTVGKLLTHKHPSTTQRYAHLSDQAVRQAAQKSSELLVPKPRQMSKAME